MDDERMAAPLMCGMLMIFVAAAVDVTSGQVFSAHPVNSTVLQGGIADFRCRLNGVYPCTNIYWVKYVGSGNVRYRTKKYISTCVGLTDRKYFDETRYSVTKQNINEYRLEIRDIRPSDAGAYGCVYQDNNMNVNRPSAIASLIVLNSWPRPNCNVTPRNPVVGETVKFTCSPPAGSPSLPLTWTYRKSADFGGTMTVHPRQSYDIMWQLRTTENYEYFTCFAGYGNAVKGCTVSPLKIPPTPVVSPVIVRKVEGDNAEFQCQVVISTPSIKSRVWFVVDGDQKLHRFSNSSGRYRVLDDNASFRIKHVTERDNNTHVWCTARNERGIYSEATGTARLLVMSQGSHIIRNTIEDAVRDSVSEYDEEQMSSVDDISASDNTNGAKGHSAAVAGGTAAAIFLVVVVIVLWIYLLKGRLKTMKKKIRGSPDSQNDSSPLTILTTDKTYDRGLEMCEYNEPPDVTKVTPSTQSLASRQQRDIDDVVVYALPFSKGSETMRPMPFRSSHDYHTKTQTLPARHGRSRKTHTVCMTYQDNKGSSLPATPLLSRRTTKRRGTATEDVKADFRDRQASFIPANHRSHGRASCRIPMQAPVLSQCNIDNRASSLPNSPQTVRASRRRHTKDEIVLYALPLQKGGGTLRMKSSSSVADIIKNDANDLISKKRSRFGTSVSKGKKRSLVSSLSLTELRFGSRKSIKLSSEQRQRKNIEGLVYADLELSTGSMGDKESIIGEDERTVYADIKGISMDL
ncbi:uncharacterized protein [Amphiura filiformis]|uniref:uncharacterized protein n=1 Tax=Amphiura filiformis TaxID=82378 RepID=UPI003B2216C3